MILPSEKAAASRTAAKKTGSQYNLQAKGGGYILFGYDLALGRWFDVYLRGEDNPIIEESRLKQHELGALLKEYGKPGRDLRTAIQAIMLDAEPSQYGLRDRAVSSRRARFSEGEKGRAEFKKWMKKQPENFREEWKEQTELHEGEFEEAMMLKTSPAEDALPVEMACGEKYASKTAASGLYGYTKKTQKDVQASVNRAQKHALKVAREIYRKDPRTVDFLKAHSKRAGSKISKLLLTAMKNIGPKVASSESVYREGLVAGLEGQPRNPYRNPSQKRQWEAGFTDGRENRTASQNGKVAGGLYGYPAKTVRLALSACSDVRARIGEIAYGLHSRRATKYARITGFLKEHGKTAKCAYSRILLDCYPDMHTASSKKAGAAAGIILPVEHKNRRS
jgi:ribosome modulation factor